MMMKIKYFCLITLLFVGMCFGGKKTKREFNKIEHILKLTKSKIIERKLNNISTQFKNLDPLNKNYGEKLKAILSKMDTIRAEHQMHMKKMDEQIAHLVKQQAILDASILLAERAKK